MHFLLALAHASPPCVEQTWFADADGDGFGARTPLGHGCPPPAGTSVNALDCDDGRPDVHPGAAEVCSDLTDDNCDGSLGCSALTADAIRYGVGLRSWAGSTLAAEDFTLDGVGDLVIGAPGESSIVSGNGAIYIADGAVTGARPMTADAFRLRGATASADVGAWGLGACDATGDGLMDLLLGSRRDASGGELAGAVMVWPGPLSGEASLDDTPIRLTGDTGDATGDSVSCRWEGDALTLLIGAGNADAAGTNSGLAWLLTGPLAAGAPLADVGVALLGESVGDNAGVGVLAPGDLDGDGVADAVVGGSGMGSIQGGAWVVLAPPATGSMALGDADARFDGVAIRGYAGTSLARAGDTDGDGSMDLLIGEYGGDAAYLLRGPIRTSRSLADADAVFVGPEPYSDFGKTVLGDFDLDGDGAPELAIGAPDHGAGAVWLYAGASSGVAPVALGSIEGVEAQDGFGISMAVVRGADDALAIGAYRGGLGFRGAVYVFNADTLMP